MAEQREPVKRRVALKIIKLGMDRRQVVARFEAERQALAMMDHANIVRIFDAGTMESTAIRVGESASRRTGEAPTPRHPDTPFHLSSGRPYRRSRCRDKLVGDGVSGTDPSDFARPQAPVSSVSFHPDVAGSFPPGKMDW